MKRLLIESGSSPPITAAAAIASLTLHVTRVLQMADISQLAFSSETKIVSLSVIMVITSVATVAIIISFANSVDFVTQT